MDINLYDMIKKGLKDYFSKLNLSKPYDVTIVGYEPSEPKYPLIVIDEVDNTPYENIQHYMQTVSSVSYKIDIYAETKGNIAKQTIARALMKYCDNYLKCINLKQVSMNTFPNEGINGKLYHIVLMYSNRFFENKQYFI